MNDQLAFNLARAEETRVSDADLARLIAFLRLRGWVKAHEISEHLTWPDRKVRAVARASKGHILSYPGSPGYKLTIEATVEEIKSADALKDQADDMRARWLEIERVFHSKQALPAPEISE